jgi:hypothetical protein
MRSRILMGGILSCDLAVAPIYAQRPPAPQLLPRDTLAYLRIADTRELVASFLNTGMGRLMNDDQVRPLLQGFYGSITQPLEGAEQRLGLTLITGLNVRKGAPNQSPMPASMVQSAGSALMANDYSCAFINWTYDERYLSRSDIKSVMSQLSGKAAARPARSCSRAPLALPGFSGIALKVATVSKDGDHIVNLTWSGAAGTQVAAEASTKRPFWT